MKRITHFPRWLTVWSERWRDKPPTPAQLGLPKPSKKKGK